MANYQYATPLTMIGSELERDSIALPLPYKVTDIRFATVANGGRVHNTVTGGGSGLVTMPADFEIRTTPLDESTQVPHEFEYYDPVTGNIVLHFMSGPLVEDENQTFYFCYGNDAVITSQEQISTLWTDYLAVYHFAEPSGNIFYNSASDDHHLDRTTVSATGRTGAFGYGVEFDGVDDYLKIGTFLGGANTDLTAEYIYSTTHRPAGDTYMTPFASTGGSGYWKFNLWTGLGVTGDGPRADARYRASLDYTYPVPEIYSGSWIYHGMEIYWKSAAGGYYYHNGTESTEGGSSRHQSTILNDWSDLTDVILGRRSYDANDNNYNGFLDEVRIRDSGGPDSVWPTTNMAKIVFNPDAWELGDESTITGRVFCSGVGFESDT